MASRDGDLSNMEIRQLDYAHRQKLGQFMDLNDCWKRLMDRIPVTLRPVRSTDRRFSNEDICAIDRAVHNSGGAYRSQTELFLEEWSTMGRDRPTIQDLLVLCQEIGALDAASYICDKILQQPCDNLTLSTSDFVDFDYDFDDLLEADLGVVVEEISDIIEGIEEPENTLKAHAFKYTYLENISNGFSEDRFLGKGGFSTVYRGVTRRNQMQVAIKKIDHNRSDPASTDRQLNYEIDQLPRLRHPNIIELLGYSNDVSNRACLIYPYMANGTLEKKLKVKLIDEALTGEQRWGIARGIASGLNHIHSRQKPLIHRDIKTSNILLDENFAPKIADFGLLRFGVSGDGDTQTETQSVKGTPVYMPPEAIRGDVSAKWDVWSYGVVLLEILTGLPVLDRTREDHDLVTHIQTQSGETNFSVVSILDPLADFHFGQAELVFNISEKCTNHHKKNRPSMFQILKNFEDHDKNQNR